MLIILATVSKVCQHRGKDGLSTWLLSKNSWSGARYCRNDCFSVLKITVPQLPVTTLKHWRNWSYTQAGEEHSQVRNINFKGHKHLSELTWTIQQWCGWRIISWVICLSTPGKKSSSCQKSHKILNIRSCFSYEKYLTTDEVQTNLFFPFSPHSAKSLQRKCQDHSLLPFSTEFPLSSVLTCKKPTPNQTQPTKQAKKTPTKPPASHPYWTYQIYCCYLGLFLNGTPVALVNYKILPNSSKDQKIHCAFLVSPHSAWLHSHQGCFLPSILSLGITEVNYPLSFHNLLFLNSINYLFSPPALQDRD